MATQFTEAPERIYLCVGDELRPSPTGFSSLHGVTWCENRQGPQDIEYVRAGATMALDARVPPEPVHRFAIVKDRHYDGEGLSLATWTGVDYMFPDGDCFQRDGDTLDGYTAEWLTDAQLEARLNAALALSTPAAPESQAEHD